MEREGTSVRREKEEIRERSERENACRGYSEKENEIAREIKRRSRRERREDAAEEEHIGKLKKKEELAEE